MHRALVVLALVLQPVLALSVAAEPTAMLARAGFPSDGMSSMGLMLPKAYGFQTDASGAGSGKSPKLIDDWPLVARQYGISVAGSAVAGALGFYIGSGIETAIVGEEEAHHGWLSFTAIRYDNFYGAFWGGVTGGLLGSSLATYFVGQTDEEDGSLFWTMVGTGAAGAGALYIASLMGVNEHQDWTPFIPLLALPSVGGVAGFNISRWFSDRKRESVVKSESAQSGVHWQPPRVGLGGASGGTLVSLQALNFTF
jgi:hypothetical protein